MIDIIRNILNLNERYAYALIGKLRQLFIPIFNFCLSGQERRIKKTLSSNIISKIQSNNYIGIPEVSKKQLIFVLTEVDRETIMFHAENILMNRFEIFSIAVEFKHGIDWHQDFSSGFRWPKGKLYSSYEQVNVNNKADVKFPRELSRCHHFLILGQAFIISNDEKYAQCFIDHVRNWLFENPYKKSINWGCSMDVSIRACNWIFALSMLNGSKLIDKVFLNEILTSLYLHGRFIYENPEKNRSYNHNHYLSDLAGQIFIGILFKNTNSPEAESWRKNGLSEFYKEIRTQILPTGFTYERSTNYHRLVTELISYTLIVLNHNQIEIPQDIFYRVRMMFETVQNYILPNGEAPIIGDQDNGRFLPFFPYEINCQKYLLNIGSTLFNEGYFKNASGGNMIDVLFLFGGEGLSNFLSLEVSTRKLTSRAFPDAGFYILRSKSVYLFINNSGQSHYNEVPGGTHTHSDLLSYVYACQGISFLIDPGTYVYSSNPKERMKFRSTRMHNTITVDDYDQNELRENELWSFDRNALHEHIMWKSDAEIDIYEGSHTGYARLKSPVKHTRKFRLDKLADSITIQDIIEGEGRHLIKSHFHFDIGVSVENREGELYCNRDNQEIKIGFHFDKKIKYNLQLSYEDVSKGYNRREIAPYAVLSYEIDQSNICITSINAY